MKPGWILLLLGALAGPVGAQVQLADGTTLAFATVTEGRQLLTQRDDFIQRLSPFDRAARLKTDKDVSEAELLGFIGTNVLAWTDREREGLTGILTELKPRLDALALPWLRTIQFIKTTGKEEGNAAYTRTNAIILPEGKVTAAKIKQLGPVLAHELFHVLSRHNPKLREELYASIGYLPCQELAFPGELRERRLTNPDAAHNDHFIEVTAGGAPVKVVPILYSRSARYDPKKGGEFFDFLEFKFAVVTVDEAKPLPLAAADPIQPKLLGPEELSGMDKQIGRNTGYIIHPEEILADNFSLLVREATQVPSPAVLKRIQAILAGARTAKP